MPEETRWELATRRDERLTVLAFMSGSRKFLSFASALIRYGASPRLAYFGAWLFALRLLDIQDGADIAGWPSAKQWRAVLGPEADTDMLDEEFAELDSTARETS